MDKYFSNGCSLVCNSSGGKEERECGDGGGDGACQAEAH